MSVKVKGYEIIQNIKNGKINALDCGLILIALIENGAVHADDVWPAEQLIKAYESVLGEFHPTDCDCVDCCDHPICGTTGVCVNHCDECNGECEVLE
tara:strand:+ start:429 stop:719 length:291 start_codon:yes stop_codon:yes gene_type:complete